MRISVTRKLLRVGRLVVARGKCTRSSPFVDGARIRFTRSAGSRTGPGESVVEQWDAGGVRIRLSRGRGAGWAMVPALDVGWRGMRTTNPHAWPVTRRGREYRRMMAESRERHIASGIVHGTAMAPPDATTARH